MRQEVGKKPEDDHRADSNGWMKVENSVGRSAEAVKQPKFGIDLLQGSRKNGPEKATKAAKAAKTAKAETEQTTAAPTPPPTSATPAASTTAGKAAKAAEMTTKAEPKQEVAARQPGADLKESPKAKAEAEDGAGKAEITTSAPGEAAGEREDAQEESKDLAER